ncbi:unnamed protein product [Clonostachys rosea]|uniref:Uncharacterized protein n=1 Tax=Bionectria ochroleuca TaxID=29856 RepID=A0ABY6UWU3_BIOOC|nr:unnamed protein product [Clonostachys rosea]
METDMEMGSAWVGLGTHSGHEGGLLGTVQILGASARSSGLGQWKFALPQAIDQVTDSATPTHESRFGPLRVTGELRLDKTGQDAIARLNSPSWGGSSALL